MKILGKKSFAHELQDLISFLLYLEMAAAVITCIFFIIAVAEGDAGELMSAWPVQIYPPVESVYKAGAIDQHIIKPRIQINAGTIEFSSEEMGYYLLKAVDAVLVFAFIIYITYLLREIFKTLTDNHPFTVANAKRLRIIAILVILVVPYKILRSAFYLNYIQDNITLTGGEWINWSGFFGLEAKGNVLLMPDVDFQALLTGLLLLIITEIFRIGVALQEDKDSII